MLKTVYFLLNEKDREDPKISGDIAETVRYIKECGYESAAAYGICEFMKAMSDMDMATTLIATDLAEEGKELLNKGYYVVGIQFEGQDDMSFPEARYIFGDLTEVDMDSFVKAYQRYAGEPWEVMRTDRLIIRETTLEDVDEFYRIYADPEMTRYMEGLFEDPEDEKRYQKDYIEKVYGLMGFGVWTLIRAEDGRIIGRAGYSVRNGCDNVELGFLVGTQFQRQGYALEACRAILDYGRDVLQLESVQTLVKSENVASIRMCEKLGFEILDEVNVEENIYGNQYRGGKRIEMGQTRYGKYVRMIKHLL